ncbi:MAG TPA: hypothetical protein VIM11_15280 [Tepidisphaeraceae bacterium]|jgi:hypothetical protein
MIGKPMRCTVCAAVFAIKKPAGESIEVKPATVATSELSDKHRGDVVGIKQGAAHDELGQAAAREADPQLTRPGPRQDFPLSDAVEGWLPLTVGVIAAVWVTAQLFGSNRSGQAWVPCLRLGVVAAMYFGCIAPWTFKTIKERFRTMHRVLPADAYKRAVLTFALPAAMGYEFWQANGGVVGMATGILFGLALMAPVFWLLFRLTQQEAASTYPSASGSFLAGSGLAALLLVGVSAVLNLVLVLSHTASELTESPLAEPLAWKTPTARSESPIPPVPPSNSGVAKVSQPSIQERTPAATTPMPVVGMQKQPQTAEENAARRGNSAMSDRGTTETRTTPPRPITPPEVFVNPDDDSFVDSIRGANLPWVKSVTKADGPLPFDFMISPTGQSQFIGLAGATEGRRRIVLWPANVLVPDMADDSSDMRTLGDRYLLTNDGRAVLHARGGAELDVFATMDDRRAVVQMDVPSSSGQALKPKLVGVMADSNVLVRWSAPDAGEIYLYRYQYVERTKVSRLIVPGSVGTPDVCGVGANEAGPVFYACLAQTPGNGPTLKLINVTSKFEKVETRSRSFPPDMTDTAAYERGELSFSPDGTRVAMLLERGDSAQVIAWLTAETASTATSRLTIPNPIAAGIAGKVRGPSLRWISNSVFITYGRTLVNANRGVVGTLTDGLVIGEQTTPDHKLYLNYVLPDMHSHMAVVEFDVDALAKAAQ